MSPECTADRPPFPKLPLEQLSLSHRKAVSIAFPNAAFVGEKGLINSSNHWLVRRDQKVTPPEAPKSP